MQKATLIPVTFHGEPVELVDLDGQPYVAMKRIVTNLGLDWRGQQAKLTAKFGSVMEEISTTGADGKVYSMVCLPLRKLAAWLYSINANKLALRLRAKVLAYQAECDDALWDYWTKGMAANPRMAQSPLTVHETLAISKECVRLQEKVAECTNPVLARELYKHLVRQTAALGDTVAALELLAPAVRQQALALEGGAT